MRKKSFLILTSLILLIVFIFVFYIFLCKNFESNNIDNEVKTAEKIKKEITKKEDDYNESAKDNEINIKDDNTNNYSNDVSTSKSSKNNMESNYTSNSNVINNNSNKESNSNLTPESSNNNQTNNETVPVEPVRELTEWEKLGISEYDYYNTPSENEGELAFKGNTSLCQNEINRLVNQYYDSGIDGGNYYTVNGKYTHAYLGCGIKMYMNGNAYTYSQIKSMGFK